MADSFQKYTGGNSPYTFSKPFLRKTDVKVEVNGTLRSSGVTVNPVGTYPYSSATVTLSADAGGSDVVKIYRDTDVSGVMYKDFTDGSVLKALDLDDIQRYLLFVSQEKAESTKDYEGALPLGHVRQIVTNAQHGSEMSASTSTGTYIKSACRITATPKAWASTWVVFGTVGVLVHSPTSGTDNSGITLKLFKDDSASVDGNQSGGTALGAGTGGATYRQTDRNSINNDNAYLLFPIALTFTTANRTEFTIDVFGKLISGAGEEFTVYGNVTKSTLHAVEIA